MKTRIYLDHAATTPLLPEVKAAMEPWLTLSFGNPSSLYREGRQAKDAIDEAREVISGRIGCLFAEILFTSSGTESVNLAIIGTALANEDRSRNRILFASAEHHAVLHTEPILRRLGYSVDLVPVDQIARIDLDTLASRLGPDVLLVSVMHANNELGTIQPIQEVGELARRHGALYHCDAIQTMPHWLHPQTQFPDLLSFSAHKLYGPKGAGAIYVKAGTKIKPLAVGGGQEREMRAGTENVAAIVGFAEAVKESSPLDPSPRNRFAEKLLGAGFVQTAPIATVLPGHCHVRYPGVGAETILIRLDRAGISASSGAACSSGSLEPSHVLRACGYSEAESKEGLRFTFGRDNTIEEADEAADRVIQEIKQIA